MKIFVYKALIVVFLSFLFFEFTIGQKIKEINSKIEILNSKQEREKIVMTGLLLILRGPNV